MFVVTAPTAAKPTYALQSSTVISNRRLHPRVYPEMARPAIRFQLRGAAAGPTLRLDQDRPAATLNSPPLHSCLVRARALCARATGPVRLRKPATTGHELPLPCYDSRFMETGIIGLPQVGKTTLFRILTRAHVDSKGGQATHVGVAKVPEPRLLELAKLYKPKKITYATVNYVDLGGMQKERMRESLASLREVDAVAHVIRVFEDPSVPHVEGNIDPLRDATNLELELILSDHEQVVKRLERVDKDLKKKRDAALELEKSVLEKCKAHLEAEKPLRELPLTAEERKPIGGFLFLSQRPMLYVLNLGDEEAAELSTAVERHKLGALEGRPNTAVVAVCGRLEAELAEMEEKEAAELLASYGLAEPGLNRLIRATYDLMGLLQFFTAGEPEVRAWTIHKGSTAVKAAGAIHSDIEKGFIRAEVGRGNDLVSAGSIAAAKEKAQVRLEGKDYIVQEGDVILFRHSG